jgi:hypothetical protein
VTITSKAAGFGLLAYGIGTPIVFMTIGSPGGDYSESAVATYTSSGHAAAAIALAYLGAFAALGLLVFAGRLRHQVTSGGDAIWGLAVAATAAAVIGWFLVGGVAVAFAEGGLPVSGVPHPVVYILTEMSNLIAVCSSAFLVGVLALVLAARTALPHWLRITTCIAGLCGMLAAFYFPLFLFWLWAIAFAAWTVATPTRTPKPTLSGAPA